MIAYLITAHSNVSNIYSLVASIYDEKNIYLIHIDGDVPPVFVERLSPLLGKPNIHIRHGSPISWNMASILDATLHGIETLRVLSEDWSHFIILSGDDLALQSQDSIERLVNESGENTCFIGTPDRAPKGTRFDEIAESDARIGFAALYQRPFGSPADSRTINRSLVTQLIFPRKIDFLVAPRSSFEWTASRTRMLQNFAEAPELGFSINRPLPWYLGNVRAELVEKFGWAFGPAWVVLSRGFCNWVLNDPAPKLFYCAFRTIGALDEVFFSTLIDSAPAEFRDKWQNRSLTYCPWHIQDLVLTEEDVADISGSFCRKIVPGRSDSFVSRAIAKLASERQADPTVGYIMGSDLSRREFVLTDALNLNGSWNVVDGDGQAVGKLEFGENGQVNSENCDLKATDWRVTSQGLTLNIATEHQPREFPIYSSNGETAFVSTASARQISYTLCAPLAHHFLADQDEFLYQNVVDIKGPFDSKISSSEFEISMLSLFEKAEFYWRDIYMSDKSEESRRISFANGGFSMISDNPNIGELFGNKIHVKGKQTLIVFDKGVDARNRGIGSDIIVNNDGVQIVVRFPSKNMTKRKWAYQACEFRKEIDFKEDNKVSADGEDFGFWKVRAGRLLILGAHGLFVFDQCVHQRRFTRLIGSRTAETRNPIRATLTGMTPD